MNFEMVQKTHSKVDFEISVFSFPYYSDKCI